MTELLRKDFMAWLCSTPPRAIVGYRRNRFYCPVSRYLGPDSIVCTGTYMVNDENTHRLPLWARKFVNILDRHRDNRVVRADEAVVVLLRTYKRNMWLNKAHQ